MALPAMQPAPAPDETTALLRELVTLNRAILSALERTRGAAPADDGRPARLLAALADAMNDFDLPFDALEVLDHGTLHHALAEALAACGTQTAPALGALFRSLRNRNLDGLMLVRDGRSWRLVRCT